MDRERLRKLLGHAAVPWIVVVAVSLVWGASLGFNYGASNQVTYMLPSLRLLDPSILNQDWFAAQTTHVHPTFTYFAAALIWLRPDGWAVGVANMVVCAAGLASLYAIIAAIAPRALALPAWLLLMAIAFLTRTQGPGTSYVFESILQPSAVASAATLVAFALFVRGHYLATGIALGVSGLFHGNFLVLEIPVFAFALAVAGTGSFVKNAIRLFAAPTVVLLILSPMLFAAATSPAGPETQQLMQEVRGPHHYRVAGFEHAFLPWIGWQLVGFGCTTLRPSEPGSPGRRLALLTAVLTSFIWLAVLFSTLVPVRAVNHLFAWRLAPHGELLLVAVACVTAAETLVAPKDAIRRASIGPVASVAAGLGILIMALSVHEQQRAAKTLLWTAALVAFALAASVSEPPAVAVRAWEKYHAWLLVLLGLGGVVLNARSALGEIVQRSNLIRGASGGELCAWVAEHTSKDAVFAIPPDDETFRFWCQRAIVVDWKSCPLMGREVQQWHERLRDVTGAKEITGRKDLAGYDLLDAPRATMLHDKYGVRYVMVRNKEKADPEPLGVGKPVYVGPGTTIWDIEAP